MLNLIILLLWLLKKILNLVEFIINLLLMLNENNETEIIEAEEVDTGKIDWDW